MKINSFNKDNIKITIIDDKIETDDFCYEIRVNRKFLNSLFLNQLMKNKSKMTLNVNLTEREKEVLLHISKGESNEKIAHEMHVSIHTIKLHLRNIFRKLDVKDRTEAAVKAIRYNIIDINF